MKTEIIYEDRDLLVIRKPAGLATQTAGVGQADAVSELKNYIASSGGARSPYLGIIHRLDQPVEGLLAFAKNKKTAAALTAQLCRQGEDKALNKQYYAVICGKPSREEGELVDYMYRDKRSGKALIAEDYTGCQREDGKSAEEPISGERERRLEKCVGITPKRAVLRYRIVQTARTSSGQELSLADIRIETGRFHQIRAQMAHAGMALLGDEKYADEAVKACSRRLGIRNAALCAGSLSLIHPVTGEKLRFEIKPCSEAFSYFKM